MQRQSRGLAFALALICGSGSATAQTLNQFLVFGDSTVDSGFYRALTNPGGGGISNAQWAAAVAAGAGKPTDSPGLMSSEALAALFGLTATPANQPGGTNFASSGAKDIASNAASNGGFRAATPTATQIANYLAANGGRANPNALYLISSGGNDVSFATGLSGAGPFPADPAGFLSQTAGSFAAAIANLHAAGAKFIIVRGLSYSFGSAATQANRLQYTQALWSDLQAAGVNFVPSDVNAAHRAIVATPSAFGFQFINATNPACTKPAGVASAWALLCSSLPGAPSHLVTPDAATTHLFADDQHFTSAGQKVIADYEYSLVVAPSEISYLAEASIKTRAGIVNAIDVQIPLSFGQPGVYHAWATGDLSWLKMSNDRSGFPNDPGFPAMATIGFDYRISPDWLVGGAISAGLTRQTFSLGGDFKQEEFTLSIYGGYRRAPYWLNAIASWGAIRDEVKRQVPISITQQPNIGTTWGRNISLALETGYEFNSPSKSSHAPAGVTHGPVFGIVLQHVDVNGFTEHDNFALSGGFTALLFDKQVRNSAVTEIGYQATFDGGRWQPFVKAAWNHEWADPNRLVTASLTTIAAPAFSMPAVKLGNDWAIAIAGTRYRIGVDTSVFGALIGQFGNRAADLGGQFGINVALIPR
jgi:outer membrane lipase/esterase